jgi:hypothetical protein
MAGPNLLLCHGNQHFGLVGLDPDKTLTVDDDPRAKPDIVLDIRKYRVKGCHIFERVYMMYCPISGDYKAFTDIVNNIVKEALVPGGLFFVPDHFKEKTHEFIESLGFIHVPYSNEFGVPQRTKDTDPRGLLITRKLNSDEKWSAGRKLDNMKAYKLL